jgi:hypothetical protein
MWVDAHSGEDADSSIVAHGRFGQACSSCQRNRVPQSAKPKEAIVQQELLEFMSHEATERRLAVLETVWIGSSEESSM